jgi:hypothetical protein
MVRRVVSTDNWSLHLNTIELEFEFSEVAEESADQTVYDLGLHCGWSARRLHPFLVSLFLAASNSGNGSIVHWAQQFGFHGYMDYH